MAIRITCAKCRQRYALADDMAGKTVRCRRCEAAISVPGGSQGCDELEVVDDLGPTSAQPLQPGNAPFSYSSGNKPGYVPPGSSYVPPNAFAVAPGAGGSGAANGNVLKWVIAAAGATLLVVVLGIVVVSQWRPAQQATVAHQPVDPAGKSSTVGSGSKPAAAPPGKSGAILTKSTPGTSPPRGTRTTRPNPPGGSAPNGSSEPPVGAYLVGVVLGLVIGPLLSGLILCGAVWLHNRFAGEESIPSPTYGKAVVIALAIMVTNGIMAVGIGFAFGENLFQPPQPGNQEITAAPLIQMFVGLFVIASFLTAMLPTSPGRAIAVMFCYFVVGMVSLMAIMLVIAVIGFAIVLLAGGL